MLDSLPLLTLYLSERCNSRCVTCDHWRHRTKDPSLESVRRLLPDLTALRTRTVLLSGAEPLMNPEWPEIAALRTSIRAGQRSECAQCVCSMWRDSATFATETFQQRVGGDV